MARQPLKTFQDAEATYARAAKYELESNWNQAFRLYIEAIEAFLHLSRIGADEGLRRKCKASAGKALERAEKIKSIRRELAPVSISHFSEQQQFYVLKKSSLINNVRYPLWNEPSGQTPQDSAFGSLSRQPTSFVWRRPNEAIPGASIGSTSLLPDDIRQNTVNDCSVCASIAVCIEHNNRMGSKLLMSNLFPQNDEGIPVLSETGKYELKFFVNGDHRRVVDDYLPFNEHGTLMGLSTGAKKQLWPSLVEKGYMKLMGGYDFPGSTSGIDLHVLTGWVPEHVEIQSATFEREKTWSRAISAFMKGHCVLTLGTDDKTSGTYLHLVPSHGYAVTDVRETGGERWMTLLDSRICCPQNDSGGSRCPGAGTLTPHLRVLDVSWDDVCGLFDGVYLSWDPSIFKHAITFHGIWKQKTTEEKSQSSNHHLLLRYQAGEEDADQEIWVLLTRHLFDSHRTSEYIALNVQNQDGDDAAGDPGRIATKGTYTNDTHVLVRTRAEQTSGALGLLACYDGPSEEVCFTVTAYSSRKISWDTTIPSPPYTAKIDGTLTSKNAGGNCTHPTYMVNPQYHLQIHPDQKGAQYAGTKAGVVFAVQGPRDMPLNITVVWSSGERTVELSQKEVVANSGAYTYGHVRIATSLLAGDYTVIVSTFEPNQLGLFSVRVESERRFELKAIPQEGAGMYNRVVRGEWDADTAAGGPSYGRYRFNPLYEIVVPTTTVFGARLQVVKASPPVSISLSLFSTSALDHCIAASGPYSDAISGVDIPMRSLSPGKYYLVPSTYSPGIQTQFRLISYSSVAGVTVTQRRAGA
ncbi:cysteine proteinase [Leucogyrophana mollusca]|uniref:Cysteine proteinase n=1 Tax=Leucogyrophana mollusca TaxID=85980 RepID=A0ACB8BJ98_9AGAM|nr:cysteine proteinase [Leucogyrophana mollusca]